MKSFRNTVLPDSDDWQAQAWKYLELVGELAYYAGWRSASASRCRLVASELDENGKPTGDTDDTVVRDIVRDIAGGVTGQSAILQRHVFLLTIPGECWGAMLVRDPSREENSDGSPVVASELEALIGRSEDGGFPEEWFTFGRDEISFRGQGIQLTLPDGRRHMFDPDVDLLFRIWNPHPRNARIPVSPVWATRTALNEIVQATATIDNAAKSRLVGNGIMFVPQEMSLPKQQAPTAQLAQGEDPPPDEIPQWQPASSSNLQELIYQVATVAFKKPDSLAALLPIIAAAPGDYIKNIQWLRPISDIPEKALDTRDRAMKRLAMGLDVSPERLLGMGTNSNHWSSWLADESDVKIHIAPAVEVVCDAYTKEVLRPALIQAGKDPTKFVVWYDDTDLTQDPDKKTEAKDAYDRGALSGTALREHFGFDADDGYDLTTQSGIEEFARDKIAEDPTLIPMLIPVLGSMFADITPKALPAPPVNPALPPGQTPPVGAEGPPVQPTTAPDPNAIPAAAYGLTRMCLSRALELANKRRRTRSNVESFRSIPIQDAHTRLPNVVGDVAKLIAGWDDTVETSMVIAVGLDPTKFCALVESAATRALHHSSGATIGLREFMEACH